MHSLSKKVLKKLIKINSSRIYIFVGLIFLIFGAVNYYRVRILSFNGNLEPSNSISGQIPKQLIIPSIKIDSQIDTGSIKNGVWEISYDKPTFLVSSAGVLGGGNTVIYGHNKTKIFGNLPYLSIGQKIIIKSESGSEITYEVYKKDFVRPNRIDLVSPTNFEELTLYTCWGIFDQDRVVIKAKPVTNF